MLPTLHSVLNRTQKQVQKQNIYPLVIGEIESILFTTLPSKASSPLAKPRVPEIKVHKDPGARGGSHHTPSSPAHRHLPGYALQRWMCHLEGKMPGVHMMFLASCCWMESNHLSLKSIICLHGLLGFFVVVV